MLRKSMSFSSIFILFFLCCQDSGDSDSGKLKLMQLNVSNIYCDEDQYNAEGEFIDTKVSRYGTGSKIPSTDTEEDFTLTNQGENSYLMQWSTHINESIDYQSDGYLQVKLSGSLGNRLANFELSELRVYEDGSIISYEFIGNSLPESDSNEHLGAEGIETCSVVTHVKRTQIDENNIIRKKIVDFTCKDDSKVTLLTYY